MNKVNTIKTLFIHKLGGYTKDEYNKDQSMHYNKGSYMAYYNTYEYIKRLNGLSKQEWIDKVWTYIDKKRNE